MQLGFITQQPQTWIKINDRHRQTTTKISASHEGLDSYSFLLWWSFALESCFPQHTRLPVCSSSWFPLLTSTVIWGHHFGPMSLEWWSVSFFVVWIRNEIATVESFIPDDREQCTRVAYSRRNHQSFAKCPITFTTNDNPEHAKIYHGRTRRIVTVGKFLICCFMGSADKKQRKPHIGGYCTNAPVSIFNLFYHFLGIFQDRITIKIHSMHSALHQ